MSQSKISDYDAGEMKGLAVIGGKCVSPNDCLAIAVWAQKLINRPVEKSIGSCMAMAAGHALTWSIEWLEENGHKEVAEAFQAAILAMRDAAEESDDTGEPSSEA